MKIQCRAALLIALPLLACLADSALGQSLPVTAVGVTPGQFAVSPNGQATYTIPIWTPPGVRGVQPSLSLTYNSAGGSGLIGPGWFLAGFSQISRCQKTYEQDGVASPVLLSMADVFCIDGKRLRVTSGLATYGQPDSTYQTEIADFSLITARDAAGNGPAWFEVKGKNGLIYEYGYTADSRALLPNTTTPYAWALNKVRDRQGNNMAISYVQSYGTLIPTTVQYTQTPTTGSTYPYTVGFYYASRPANDQTTGYIAGAPFSVASQLSVIEVRAGTTLLRKYRLTYNGSPTTQRSRLSSVQECAGAAGTDCKSATTINYQNGQAGVPIPSLVSGAISGWEGRKKVADVNGDGRMDLLYEQVSGPAVEWWVRFATANGFDPPVSTGAVVTPAENVNVLFDDFIGTGQVSLLAPSAGTWRLHRWNGTGFSITSSGLAVDPNRVSVFGGLSFVPADVNGDGLPDLVWATTASGTPAIHTRLNTSSAGVVSFSSTMTSAYPIPDQFTGLYGAYSSNTSEVTHSDLNGDGREDVVLWTLSGNLYSARQLISQGTTFATGPIQSDASFGEPQVLNWNNDACTDLVHQSFIYVSACNGTYGQPISIGPFGARLLMDWNGDGRSDVLVVMGGVWNVRLSEGTSIAAPIATDIPVTGNDSWAVLDQNGDGLSDILKWDDYDGSLSRGLHNGAGTPPDFISSIVDGFGNTFSPTFKSIVQSNYAENYFGIDPATFPDVKYTGPLYVVDQFMASNGIGGTYQNQFFYWSARKNLQGRGFKGFAVRRIFDSRNSLYRIEEYRQDMPFIGLVSREQVLQPNNGTIISSVSNTYDRTVLDNTAFNQRYFSYLAQAQGQDYEVGGLYNGTHVLTTTTNNTFDAWGTLTDQTTTTTEVATGSNPGATHTQRTYHPTVVNDTANWCLGRPTQTQQINSHTLPGGAPITRTVSRSWDYAACRLTQEVVEPGSSQWQVTTNLNYDTVGNVKSILVTPAAGQGQNPRTTLIDWGSDGRAPRTITNPAGHITQLQWDFEAGGCTAGTAPLGTLRCATDPNSLTTQFTTDSFGRRTRVQRPDGTATDFARGACNVENSYCGASDLRSSLQVIARNTANAAIRTDTQYFDSFDRLRYDYRQMLSGANSGVITTYDALGRLASQSAPFTSGDPTSYATTTYDLIDRPTLIRRQTSESDTSNHDTLISYEGLSRVDTDALSRNTRTRYDAIGQIVQVIDAAGSDTDYEYDAFGNLLKTRDVNGNEITLTYNVRGMKMTSSDPDMGNWTYNYFPLGELKSQTDAKSQTATFTYDELSRPLARVEAEGTTTWTWGTSAASRNIGQLQSISALGYSESFSYDSLGRLANRNIASDAPYNYDFTYDAVTGALKTLEYPTSTSSYRLKLQYAYQNAMLHQIKDANASTVFWEANSVNALGQVTQETLGNGVVTNRSIDRVSGGLNSIQAGAGGGAALQNESYLFDKVGNLTQRQNNQLGRTEDFYYDALDRLDYSKLGGVINLDLAYDAMGNITSRSDVSTSTWTYHTTKKHAVVQAGSNTYSYDANGNAQTRNGYSLSWTSYNYPSVISGPGKTMTFSYGPDRQRYRQVYTNGSTTETTIYVGGLLEKVTENGITDWRHSVFAGDNAVAIVSRKSNGTNATRYLLRDHQGSIAKILDASGGTFVSESFAAFGARRDANAWSGPCPCPDLQNIKSVSHSGYTGHEMIGGQSMGLIHMNGRVYDSTIGRFLSADPYVQAPFFSQSLNRYSYAFNNPLSYTDPSGFNADGGSSWGIDIGLGGLFGDNEGRISSNCAPDDYSGLCRAVNESRESGCAVSDSQCRADWRAAHPRPTTPTPTPDDPLTPTPEPIPGPTAQPLPAGPEGIGGLGSTVGGTCGNGSTAGMCHTAPAPLPPAVQAAYRITDAIRETWDLLNRPKTFVTEDGREIPFITGTPPLPVVVGRAATALKGLGNIGSHGAVDASTALSSGVKWLGTGYKEIAPGVFRSADGLRQFRMTTADLVPTHGKIGSHVHFEALDDIGKVIENLHLPVIP